MKKLAAIVAILAIALATGCTGKSGGEDGPYLKIIGGSFIFNYRLAYAFAGVLMISERDLPTGSTIEVWFQNPTGGPPLVMTKPAGPEKDRYEFTIEPIDGIKANVDYVATVRLIGPDGKELQKLERVYRSEIDQTLALPDKPLTIGPGYTPNPEASQ